MIKNDRKEAVCLREKLRTLIPGSVVTLLYALGLTLTLLFALGLMDSAGAAIVPMVVLTAAFSAAALDRRAAWLTAFCAAAAAVIGLLMGGAAAIGQVLLALEMHILGVGTALPFVAQETALLGSILCTAAAFFVTQRSAGPYPALVLLLLTVVLIWLSDMTQALWCLLPSVIACVTLLLQGEHDITAFRVLPMAVVITALSFAGVAAGGATIPALKDAADTLRQRIYDIFFFTGSREEFSLADVGYYPQGEGQLGGPAEPSIEPVMAVITPRKVYLRGVIRNVYTGRSWEDGTESKRYLWAGPRFQAIRETAFDMALPAVNDPAYGALLSQRKVIVRMLGGSASSMFVPQRVRQLGTEGELTPYFNAGSEIFTTRNLSPGDVWEVDAPLFEAGERGVEQLIDACAMLADPNWEAVNRDYRALPEHLEQEVFDIAWAAIGDAQTPYQQTLAIQHYLQSSYEYTLEAPWQQSDMDFVSTFLLLNKQGYCTHFASSMTVLCRMVGLPARYVEGFVATPDETGMAVVTGEQGHAWTEVYFKGFGWLTFDATPAGQELIYITPDQIIQEPDGDAEASTPAPEMPTPTALPTETPSATPVPETTPTPEPPETTPEQTSDGTSQPDSQQEAKSPFLWVLLMAALALLAVGGRILWMTPGMQVRRKKTEFARWLVWAQAAHDALRRLGFERRPNETPMAFFARVDETNRIPRVLSQLSGAESLMFYGHADPLPEETAQAKQSFEVICAQLTAVQKLRLTLERAFWPRRSRDITVR